MLIQPLVVKKGRFHWGRPGLLIADEKGQSLKTWKEVEHDRFFARGSAVDFEVLKPKGTFRIVDQLRQLRYAEASVFYRFCLREVISFAMPVKKPTKKKGRS